MKGQALIFVLLIMLLGFVFLGAFLGLLNVNLLASGKAIDWSREYYSALSGIEAVIADLLQGKDALVGYTPPAIIINDLAVSLSISPPVEKRPIAYLYIDPGAGTGLYPLPPKSHWLVQLWGIEAGSTIAINWAFIPVKADWKIAVFEGTDITLKPVAEKEGKKSPGELEAVLTKGGIYTVVFYNEDEKEASYSKPFSPLNGKENTWIYSQLSGREYLITSQAGATILKAYIRQIPGPGPTSHLIRQKMIEWWIE